MITVITAFDSFKGSLSAAQACSAAAQGVLRACPGAQVVELPLSDGGEGLMACVARCLPVQMVRVPVHGPLMEPVVAAYALSADGQTAYLEMAAASGLTLVPEHSRNPLLTTTYGVGELLVDALRRGCSHVVMGIGGSATCDAGSGMLQALKDNDVDVNKPLCAQYQGLSLTVACDVDNPLYGPSGAAYVFAPQKGATAQQVEELDQRLRQFAIQTEASGIATSQMAYRAGAGAAGGLGYALMAYLGAELRSGIDILLDIVGFDDLLSRADLVLTGEGCSDRQTLMGKVPVGVLRRAQQHDVPVHLYSGAIQDAPLLREAGFSSIHSINQDDNRPLNILMQSQVAMQNMLHSVATTVYNS